MYKTIKYCRACKSDKLKVVTDLGNIYPSNFINNTPIVDYSDLAPIGVPLILVRCLDCDLVQLLHSVDLDLMYRQYWYRSSVNPSMKDSLRDIVENIEKRIILNSTDVVVDIGCNDGTMFDFYHTDELFKIGFEPALNLASEAEKHCHALISNYFTYAEYPLNKQAKVVTSIAMLYDLEDPNIFVEDIKKILAKNGLWVIQFTDLYSMFKINDISNVCHEHLEYYSLNFLNNFLVKHGLEVFDIEQNSTNGGSTRFYVSWPANFMKTDNYYRLLEEEKIYMSSFNDPYKAFVDRVETNKNKFLAMLDFCKNYNVPVYALGASTKANTLLQSWRVDNTLIKAIGEVSKDKFGLKTIGTEIPIIPESQLLETNPPVLVVLTWQFKNFFLKKLQPYLDKGGVVIFPLPEFDIVKKVKNGN